ncbi:MAG: C-GCAxxG-C-C family protein [Thermodesulfobacteriota bacterium]
MKSSLEETVALVVDRVANCYEKHDLCCSGSIMYVLSQAITGSGLSGRDAVQLGSGYCHGMGGAGCSCGALTGSIAILSYFLGPYGTDGLKGKKFRRCIKEMHDQFRDRFKSTCCRILSKKPKGENEQRRFSCKELTEGGAEIATHLLLKARPELIGRFDLEFLQSRQLSL